MNINLLGGAPLSFDALRAANKARLPQFKNKHGELAHFRQDGSDWTPAGWLQAVVGELGEYANNRKKFERGDLSAEEFAPLASKELADIVTYIDLLAQRCLDTSTVLEHPGLVVNGKSPIAYSWTHEAHPTGIDLGAAVTAKFNEVSERVGSTVRLGGDGWYLLNDEAGTFPQDKALDGTLGAMFDKKGTM